MWNSDFREKIAIEFVYGRAMPLINDQYVRIHICYLILSVKYYTESNIK